MWCRDLQRGQRNDERHAKGVPPRRTQESGLDLARPLHKDFMPHRHQVIVVDASKVGMLCADLGSFTGISIGLIGGAKKWVGVCVCVCVLK